VKRIVIVALFVSGFASYAVSGQIVATTSDYVSANSAIYDTVTGEFRPNAFGHADQDVVVDTDGESVYFIERTYGAVSKYDPDTIAVEDMVYQYSVGTGTNPVDIVFLDSKAYVICYAASEILIIDQNAGDEASFTLGTIDISSYDTNGVPEAIHGFVYKGMLYVVLQRLNGWAADVPGYLLKIDPETDSVVDLVPETNGIQGMELLVKNPQWFSLVGSGLYIAGHNWGEQTEGVQVVDLDELDVASPRLGAAQFMLLDESAMAMDITGVNVLSMDYGIFYSSGWIQDDAGNWVQVGAAYWFDPKTGSMGEALPVPTPDGGAVMADGIAYIGSRDDSVPGIYAVDPLSNSIVGEPMLTTLPPVSIVYVSEEPTIVERDAAGPSAFKLAAPHPNPFNPRTTISYTLTVSGRVVIDVFNVAGQRVEKLADSFMQAGVHNIQWNAEHNPSGVYFIRIKQAGVTGTVRVTLCK